MNICNDELWAQSAANGQFCRQLINWVFKESGVLRATNLRHNKKGEACPRHKSIEECPNPENYKIEDNIEFYIDLEQKIEGYWLPYVAEDIQLQFIMLEPYYSVALTREPNRSHTYTYKFRVP